MTWILEVCGSNDAKSEVHDCNANLSLNSNWCEKLTLSSEWTLLMLPFWPDQALLLYVCHEYEKSAREDQANREATSNVYWSIWDGSKQNWVVDGSDAKSTALFNGHNARKLRTIIKKASARWRFRVQTYIKPFFNCIVILLFCKDWNVVILFHLNFYKRYVRLVELNFWIKIV